MRPILLYTICLLFAANGLFAEDTLAPEPVIAPVALPEAADDGVGLAGAPVADASAMGGIGMQDMKKVYLFPIREDIMPSTARMTEKCLEKADEIGADLVVIDMNTYGGLVNSADKIRTLILNYPKPVYVYINNQAASAGALISIAADRIYMREGSSMGAATVVDQSGGEVPDKYQSFMRGMMRSTAESHGKVVDAIEGGDTVWRWFRDPRIAEAMVDPSVVVPGLVEEGKVLTFSTEEAIEWHYCEGKASSVEQLLSAAGMDNYEITEYKTTALDRILGLLTSPALQGILIMLIIGGIYFELQTPGIGFPLVVSITAALFYFAPLYLEGLLANWEIIVFIAGVILIILEIFVTPGFGVLGITGIVAVVTGLAFAMIDSELLRHIPTGEISVGYVLRPVALVIIAAAGALALSVPLGKRLLTRRSPIQERVVLNSSMRAEEGYVSHGNDSALVGAYGVTSTALRPAGKVVVDNRIYEAAGDNGRFIERGTEVVIIRYEAGVLYCRIAERA